jgi:thioester reductase-like protein
MSAAKRTEKMLRRMFDVETYLNVANRIEVFEGNIVEPNFGLSEHDYKNLTQTTNIIFHSAATIKFNLPLSEAYTINVTGTENILKFSSKCWHNNVLERLNHISTAYVTGRQNMIKDVIPDTNFVNTYELTKSQAEKLVHQYINDGLPVTIYRPSIISGNSLTGEIPTNSIVYIFLLLLSRECLPQLPGDENTSLNIVPINYFINLMFKLSEMPETIGKTYNITAEKNTPFKQMMEFGSQVLNLQLPEFIPLHQSHIMSQKILDQIETFMPYFEESHHFDLSATHEMLKCNYFESEDFKTWVLRMIQYCLEHRLIPQKKIYEKFANI